MKVTLTQSGGWAGMMMRCSVDSARLPPDAARRLESGLDALKHAVRPDVDHVRDGTLLEFDIEDGAEQQHICINEGAPSAALSAVLEILRPLLEPIPFERD